MSYSFVVTVKDGTPAATITSGPGTVPDGTYQVSGHDDDQFRTIGVTRADDSGQVAQASAYGRRV